MWLSRLMAGWQSTLTADRVCALGVVMKTMIAGVLACAALSLSGVAHAQREMTPEETAEAYCVQTQVDAAGKTQLMLDSYFIETSADEVHAEAKAEMAAAATRCSGHFGWTPEQTLVAQNLGLMSAVSNFLAIELKKGGVPDAVVQDIYGATEGLSGREMVLLFNAKWKDDEAFVEKMHTVMVGRGVPDNYMMVGVSLRLIETWLVQASELQKFQASRFGG